MSDRWRANNFRQQARGYCLALNRYLLHGVLPVELLADAALCLETAAAISQEGVVLS
jgi:hypothetical protein